MEVSYLCDDLVASRVFQDRPDMLLAARVDRVRFITPELAGDEAEASIASPDEDPSLSVVSAVFVKQDDKWRIDSIEEMPLPQPPTPYNALKDLEWLVGRWVDDSETARVPWTAGRRCGGGGGSVDDAGYVCRHLE